MILALKVAQQKKGTKAKNEFGIYIISIPINKELPGIRSYQKRGTCSNF